MKIGVSACLLGNKVRYDGRAKGCAEVMKALYDHEVYLLCPEVMGGLPVPRIPSEVQGARVVNAKGTEVTEEYTSGSRVCLSIVKKKKLDAVILKAKSPACGSHEIYDGTFTHTLINGMGVFAKMCKAEGIRIFDETEIEELKKFLEGGC